MRVDVARLIAAAKNERVFFGLENLLEFGGVGDEVAVVIEHRGALIDAQDFAGRKTFGRDDGHRVGVIKFQGVLKSATKEQRVNARAPIMMPANESIRVLKFFHTQSSAGLILIVILANVA